MIFYQKNQQRNIIINIIYRRRTCVACGNAFNICDINRDGYVMEPLNPKKEGICDACGGKLTIRDDDKKEVIYIV